MSRSLGRVVDILDSFTAERPSLSAAEVADRAGLDRATAFRFLGAMECRGLVRRDPLTKRYAPGTKLMQWGALAFECVELRAAAEPVLRRLSLETRETTALYVRDGDRRVCVATCESPQRIRHVLPLGSTLRMTQAAGGRALLAAMPRAEALACIAADPELDEAERRELITLLPRLRSQGYALGVRLMTPHAWSIAAAIYDRAGQPVAALVIAGPDVRIDAAAEARFAELLLPAAREISLAVGAPPGVWSRSEGDITRDV